MNAKELAEYCFTPEPVEPPEEPRESPNLGTVGEDLFYSYLPDSPDDCITIYDTGGWAKDPDVPRKDKTFQFMIRGASYDSAQVLANKVYDFFCPGGIPKINFNIGAYFIHQALPTQAAPFYLGRDGNDRYKFSVNFTFIVH